MGFYDSPTDFVLLLCFVWISKIYTFLFYTIDFLRSSRTKYLVSVAKNDSAEEKLLLELGFETILELEQV